MGRKPSTAAVAIACALVTSACGAALPPAMPPAAHGEAATPAAATTSPCDALTTTTPINHVAPACARRWAPYGVTEIPPSNLLVLEHVPPAPRVVNMTGGAVPDAAAQRWADASNRDSGWWKWAQANDQLFFLRFLVGPALIPAVEVEALQDGATIAQPDCNLYPLTSTLYPMSADGRAYFARRHLPTAAPYVFVVTYSGPCSETVTYRDGRSATIVDGTRPATIFTPGYLRHDAVLGDIWFGDATGACQDPAGPPLAWCGR